ncbi:MAG: hypothetical protein GVY29_03515 [Spirochaetes bacterium]|nr:hypothetical protein [Spirochaetota bacterium]
MLIHYFIAKLIGPLLFGRLEYWDHDPTRGNQNIVPNVACVHDDEGPGGVGE